MKPIFLIGYMGSGKTTLGTAVSAATGLRLVDLDEYVERRAGATIRELFASLGEDAFRRLEREALREVAAMTDVIVACGGGTPCFFDNMDLMSRCGTTVWLDASQPRLMMRLMQGRAGRPLIASLDDRALSRFIARSLEARNPYYRRADHRFAADCLDTRHQLDRSVELFIDRFIHPSLSNIPS